MIAWYCLILKTVSIWKKKEIYKYIELIALWDDCDKIQYFNCNLRIYIQSVLIELLNL